MTVAIEALRQADPVGIAAIIARVGRPALRLRPPDLAGLAAIIVAQQVSTASAAAIFGRLDAAFAPLSANRLLAATDEQFRLCGLSRTKVKTLRTAARAIADETLPLARLASMPLAEARGSLIALPGIGPWTADVFLLFCLGHADVWPVGDLALQEATRVALDLDHRPLAAEMERIGETWRPFRGAAAYILWTFYRMSARRGAGVGAGQP